MEVEDEREETPETVDDEVAADDKAETEDETDKTEEPEAGDDGDKGEEGEAEDDDLDEDDKDLGNRAQKRIKRLIAERKEAQAKQAAAEKMLEEARKLSGDDGKAMLAAAEESGILPSLMTKAEADAFKSLADYPQVIESYEDWLDDHGSDETLTLGGKEMSYGEVKKRVRRLKSELEELKDQYGSRKKELQKKVRTIFELGLEAYKKGAKPSPGGTVKKPAARAAANVPKRGKPNNPVVGDKPLKGSKKQPNWGDVRSEKDLLRMLAEQEDD